MKTSEASKSEQNPINDYIDTLIENKLNQKLKTLSFNQPAVIVQPPPNRIDINEASKVTGYSVNTIYTMKSRGTFPYHKKRGMLFFLRDELEVWMDSNV
jgi:predicted DNA-binding transcriptional regulator AlpA